jgi:lipopolysaccharide transport system permease protein
LREPPRVDDDLLRANVRRVVAPPTSMPKPAASATENDDPSRVIQLAASCFRYRELLAAFVSRELKARYRGSLLGGFWLVLQPVVFLAVYYFIFVEVLQANVFSAEDLPKGELTAIQTVFKENAGKVTALAMFVAMVPWQGLQECVGRASTTVGENANLIKKIAFPSELLPVYLVLYNLFNVVVGLVVFTAAAYLVLGVWPAVELLWLLPIVLFLQGVFMLGLGLLLAATTVFLRDLVQLVPMVMTVWFFITPIIYWRVPKAELAWVLDWNPARYMIELYRAVFLFPPGRLGPEGAESPLWRYLGIFAAVAFATLWIGLRVFRRKKYDFADEL